MKLLVISMNHSPELTGIGKYTGEMADGLVARGHEVRVVCAPPHYPQWRLGEGYGVGRYGVEDPQPGLRVWRCPLWVPTRPSAARRLLHQASFALSSLPVVLGLGLFWRPAVVLVVAPATCCAPSAWLAAALAGGRAWLHVQDLELDAAFKLGFLRGPRLQKFFLGLERRLFGSFDRVSTISRRMLEHLVAKGVELPRTSLLPNWVDLQAVDPQVHCVGAALLRQRLGLGPAQKVLLYAGTMNRKQGLDVLVQAAQRLAHRSDIIFLLCGQGEMRASLEAAAQGLAQVRFCDLRPAHELGALLTLADVHLLPQLRHAADLVMPSKLGGMLASGRPVIAAADEGSEIAMWVRDCGLRVEPESADAFVQAITALCDDDTLRQDLGTAARELAVRTLGGKAVLDHLDLELRAATAAPAWSRAPRWR